MKRAERLAQLPPYPFARWAAEVAKARRQGHDVIRLDIGNPDMPPPSEVIEALCEVVQNPSVHGYAGYRGTPALRKAIAAYYTRRFDVTLDPETEVVPLIGSKEGIVNLALAWLNPGDVVLVPDPGYAPYTMGARLAGADVYPMPLEASNGFLPVLDVIPTAIRQRAKMMWLNYPNNPTGAVTDVAFLRAAIAYAKAHDILLCYDAPYSDVTYQGYTAPSILQIEDARDVAVEFNSLSKTYNMAGWRVGMAVGCPKVLAALMQVKSNVDSGMFYPLQQAAVRALSLDPEWIRTRNDVYWERLQLLASGLSTLGMEVTLPKGALYLWVPVPEGQDAEHMARRWLFEAGVAVAPGTFFGPSGAGYVRISVTAPTSRLKEALERLRALEGG